jgi:hypothetical protein
MQLGNGVNGGVKWPFVSHFTGCKFCHAIGADPERVDSCLENFDKIYHFANDQVKKRPHIPRKLLTLFLDEPLTFASMNLTLLLSMCLIKCLLDRICWGRQRK